MVGNSLIFSDSMEMENCGELEANKWTAIKNR